ncbi:hypothetical protein [Caballeronia sordidicola]|uniref:Uncharacterized protein n=1 Tax=Caballeronia sordidicola TaxID=196367 RepID=A0A226WVY6_CABSO|nr:hypothetical protein [Caballeronia sordidicola]OXC74999.1 hypothetical protein BSU04_29115 [Caballeronia sordidicola]
MTHLRQDRTCNHEVSRNFRAVIIVLPEYGLSSTNAVRTSLGRVSELDDQDDTS